MNELKTLINIFHELLEVNLMVEYVKGGKK